MNRYDDAELQKLFNELEPKQRAKALRSAFKREAGKVKKVAVGKLKNDSVSKGKNINTSTGLEKGIRAVVFKKKTGFKVTIGTKRAGKNGKGEQGFHENRRGLKKTILIWAEEGTKNRFTKKGKHKAHAAGRMTRYGFMRKAKNEVGEEVTNALHKEVENSIVKTAKKHGCK